MKKNKLDIFIPVGGLGKRLGAITKKTPKPLIKINKEPFIIKLIKSFKRSNYDNLYLLTNYKDKSFFFLKNYIFGNKKYEIVKRLKKKLISKKI